MVRRILPAVLTLSLIVPTPAMASLRESAERHARITAAEQPAASRPANPYKTPALVLLGGGGALLLLGLMQDRGAEVSSTALGNVSVKEKGGSKTALTVLGVAAIGGGGALWFMGEGKRKPAPFRLWGSRSSVGVSGSVGF